MNMDMKVKKAFDDSFKEVKSLATEGQYAKMLEMKDLIQAVSNRMAGKCLDILNIKK